jgi:hypothetical protein
MYISIEIVVKHLFIFTNLKKQSDESQKPKSGIQEAMKMVLPQRFPQKWKK